MQLQPGFTYLPPFEGQGRACARLQSSRLSSTQPVSKGSQDLAHVGSVGFQQLPLTLVTEKQERRDCCHVLHLPPVPPPDKWTT